MGKIDTIKKVLSAVFTRSQVSKETRQNDTKKIEELKNYKKKYEPRWYLSNAFYEGVHFTLGQKDQDGNWIRVPTPKGKLIREIPKAKKHINNIRNMILKFDPKPIVYPDANQLVLDANKVGNPQVIAEEEEQAINSGRFVENYLSERMKLKRHLKKLIRYAELYNVGYIQILNNNGKKELAIYDPFEISVYPTIGHMDEANEVVKHTSRRLDDFLKKDKTYNQKLIAKALDNAEGKYSSSQFKNTMMQERYGKAPEGLVLIDEIYKMREVYDERTSQTNDKCQINSYVGEDLVREETTKLNGIPISLFTWGDEVYQSSLMEDMMPLNRVYDIYVSKLEQKVKKLDTGRIVVQKSEPMKVFTTNDGEIIQYKRFKPELMREADISNAVLEAVNRVESDLREQGVSVATMSVLPKGVEAWHAIESLKESDYASIGVQFDNLKECLTDVTEKLTDMLAYDMVAIEKTTIPNPSGQGFMGIQAVGARGAEIMTNEAQQPMPPKVAVIDPNRITKVEIESGASYTQQALKDMVFKMLELQILPLEVALQLLKVGNTQEIMDKLLRESTMGKSMIDMPDFKMLPPELQQAIVRYLADGGNVARPEDQPVNSKFKENESTIKGNIEKNSKQ